MNIGVHVSSQIKSFCVFQIHMPRNGIAGSYDSPIFRFFVFYVSLFILKMTNGSSRKIKQVALDHTASKWHSRAARPGFSHLLHVP